MIGLGHMGSEMARHLMTSGHALMVHDVVPAAVDSLVKQGAKRAASIAEMAALSDVVITMVQTSQQVHDLCMLPEGIFQHAKRGMLYIDSSSIDMVMTRKLHQEAANRGIAMLDAPVSGGVLGAEAGTLTFMAGGDQAVFERAQPILKCMGKKI